MDKKILYALISLLLLGGIFASYLYWQRSHEEAQPGATPKALAPRAESAPADVAATPPAQPAVAPLVHGDRGVLDALADIVSNDQLMKVFYVQHVIDHIVNTIDNLPQQRLSPKISPFVAPQGNFLTAGSAQQLVISRENAARYAPYVKLAEVVDAKKLVGLYVRLYPLFQTSYANLGYPQQQFNDQLLQTLDDLLQTPDVKGPIRLTQPKYFYLYADPDLQARSIGQRILLRLGSRNAGIVKAKLREIRQQLDLQKQNLPQ